jgi:hypothetical protein
MSQPLIDQITLDCLLNREIMGDHVMKQREKQINKEDLKFYRKRIFDLFRKIISNNSPSDLSPDVKYAYDTFIKSTISYFKVIDNNDLLQEEYKDIDNIEETHNETIKDNNICLLDADKLMMRSIKIDNHTLDKYVKRNNRKNQERIFLPKTREVDIMNPEFKNKGLKKNINNIYEDNKKKQEQKNT